MKSLKNIKIHDELDKDYIKKNNVKFNNNHSSPAMDSYPIVTRERAKGVIDFLKKRKKAK